MARKKQTQQEKPSSQKSHGFKEASPDHKVYTTGFVIGKQTLGNSLQKLSEQKDKSTQPSRLPHQYPLGGLTYWDKSTRPGRSF